MVQKKKKKVNVATNEVQPTRNLFQRSSVWILLSAVQICNIIIHCIQSFRFKYYCSVEFTKENQGCLVMGRVNKRTGAITENANIKLSEEEFLLVANLINQSSAPWISFVLYHEQSCKTQWFIIPAWAVKQIRRDMTSIIIHNRYLDFQNRQINLN